MKTILQFILETCYGDNKKSSKRVIMYIFTLLACFMIGIEAIFNIIYISKCIAKSINITDCKFSMVFDATIYSFVFGTIVSLAGINGFSKQGNDKEESK